MPSTLYRKTVNEVASRNTALCDITNKILYALCNHALLPTEIVPLQKGRADAFDPEYVEAQLLLISKSYSASFDRCNYKGDGLGDFKEYKKQTGAVGTGTGVFFHELAQRLTGQYRSDYQAVIQRLNGVGTYDFSQTVNGISGNDFHTLKNVILAVLDFDELIRKCIREYDNAVLKDYIAEQGKKGCSVQNIEPTRHDSACSKYLHFHFPSLVFILDFYAERHLDFHQKKDVNQTQIPMGTKPRRASSKDKTAVITFCYDDTFLYTDIPRSEEDALICKMKQEKELSGRNERYLEFACRAYLVAKEMYGYCTNPTFFVQNAPRIVDTLQAKVNQGLE